MFKSTSHHLFMFTIENLKNHCYRKTIILQYTESVGKSAYANWVNVLTSEKMISAE